MRNALDFWEMHVPQRSPKVDIFFGLASSKAQLFMVSGLPPRICIILYFSFTYHFHLYFTFHSYFTFIYKAGAKPPAQCKTPARQHPEKILRGQPSTPPRPAAQEGEAPPHDIKSPPHHIHPPRPPAPAQRNTFLYIVLPFIFYFYLHSPFICILLLFIILLLFVFLLLFIVYFYLYSTLYS